MQLSVEATELFEIAQRTDSPEDFTIFENPLCRTMFRARKRCFSDYVESVSDPLTQETANRIIDTLSEITDEEEKIKFFFEEMRQLKPFPPSQRQSVEYEYGSKDDFMNEVISSHVRPYLEAHPTAKLKRLYRELRYEIARDIEEKDFCCTRHYQALMDEIKRYISKVMPVREHSSSEEFRLFPRNTRRKTAESTTYSSTMSNSCS